MSIESDAAARIRNKGFLFLAAMGLAAGAVTAFYDEANTHMAHHLFAGPVILILAGFLGSGLGSVVAGLVKGPKAVGSGMDAGDEIAMFAASLAALPGLIAAALSPYAAYTVHAAAIGALFGALLSALPIGIMSIVHDILLITEQSDEDRKKRRTRKADRLEVMGDPKDFPRRVVMERSMEDVKGKAKK
jgi:hypothetical protein